ncbi:acyl-CoA N-acyltransferase [Hyaloscypha variabilis]
MSTLGPVVSNTEPARPIGPEPVIGQHVRLERLTEAHFADLWENVGVHVDLWTCWPEGPFNTPSEFNDNLHEFLKLLVGDLAIYSVFLLAGPHKGKAVGMAMALSEERTTNRVGEIGMFYGPFLQKTRAGTEVIYLLTRLLFELNHRRVGWKTNALNVQSRRAAERYGFVYEGTLRQHQINKGRNRDSAWFSIIDSEWPLCKEAFEAWLEDGNFDEQQQQKRKLQEIRESLMKA